MERKLTASYRLSALTVQQIDQLQQWLGTNKSETLSLAVDRMHREEAKRQQRNADNTEMVNSTTTEGKDSNGNHLS